jgi:hypothetical protein
LSEKNEFAAEFGAQEGHANFENLFTLGPRFSEMAGWLSPGRRSVL